MKGLFLLDQKPIRLFITSRSSAPARNHGQLPVSRDLLAVQCAFRKQDRIKA